MHKYRVHPPPPLHKVLTETKRAEIRARNDEIDRAEKHAKKKMVVMEDQEEMLAAAESIPIPASQVPLLAVGQEFQEPGGMGAEVGGGKRGDRRRPRSPSGVGEGGRRGGEAGGGTIFRERDPLTAWVYGCYNHDDYTGHVSDLRYFLRGIDFHHVSFLPSVMRCVVIFLLFLFKTVFFLLPIYKCK